MTIITYITQFGNTCKSAEIPAGFRHFRGLGCRNVLQVHAHPFLSRHGALAAEQWPVPSAEVIGKRDCSPSVSLSGLVSVALVGGGRSRVTASQTASRGELLTPPRCQEAPGMTPHCQGFQLEEGRLEVNINMHFYESWRCCRVREKKDMRK